MIFGGNNELNKMENVKTASQLNMNAYFYFVCI